MILFCYFLKFCHVMMVLIDRAFKELSNSGHIVRFDPNLNSDVKFGLGGGF